MRKKSRKGTQDKLPPYHQKIKVAGVEIRGIREKNINPYAFSNMTNYYIRRMKNSKTFKTYKQEEIEAIAKTIANYKLRTGQELRVRIPELNEVAIKLLKEPYFKEMMKKGLTAGLELELIFRNAMEQAENARINPKYKNEYPILKALVSKIVRKNPQYVFNEENERRAKYKKEAQEIVDDAAYSVHLLERKERKELEKEISEKITRLRKLQEEMEKIRTERQKDKREDDWITIPRSMGVEEEVIGITDEKAEKEKEFDKRVKELKEGIKKLKNARKKLN